MVREVQEKDILQIAEIHKSQFSTHFLGKYSINLIAKFYQCFLDRTVFLVNESDNKIDGFVLGGDSSRLALAKNYFLTKYKTRSLAETMFRPATWRMALQRLSFLSSQSVTVVKESHGSCRLLSIAVDCDMVGKGVSKMLIHAFEEKIGTATNQYGLSVNESNKRAIGFYKKHGFFTEKEIDGSLYLLKNLT